MGGCVFLVLDKPASASRESDACVSGLHHKMTVRQHNKYSTVLLHAWLTSATQVVGEESSATAQWWNTMHRSSLVA